MLGVVPGTLFLKLGSPWIIKALLGVFIIGTQGDASVVVIKDVVLLTALQFHAAEPLTIFKPFHGIDAEHGTAQGGVELPESRRT